MKIEKREILRKRLKKEFMKVVERLVDKEITGAIDDCEQCYGIRLGDAIVSPKINQFGRTFGDEWETANDAKLFHLFAGEDVGAKDKNENLYYMIVTKDGDGENFFVKLRDKFEIVKNIPNSVFKIQAESLLTCLCEHVYNKKIRGWKE